MRALILAGGQGTRLRPLTLVIPKPLLPIGDKPIIEWQLRQLAAAGFEEAILATGYHAELVRAYCGDGSRFNLPITYLHEETPLGTAGALSLLKPRLGAGEGVLVLNGDIWTDLDLLGFVESSVASGCAMGVAYKRIESEFPYGAISLDHDRVSGIVEKPVQRWNVNAGIYWVGPAALACVPEPRFFTMPELMERLLAGGSEILAVPIPGRWTSLERVSNFEEAVRLLDEPEDRT